jgi:hypothetical protein
MSFDTEDICHPSTVDSACHKRGVEPSSDTLLILLKMVMYIIYLLAGEDRLKITSKFSILLGTVYFINWTASHAATMSARICISSFDLISDSFS